MVCLILLDWEDNKVLISPGGCVPVCAGPKGHRALVSPRAEDGEPTDTPGPLFLVVTSLYLFSCFAPALSP